MLTVTGEQGEAAVQTLPGRSVALASRAVTCPECQAEHTILVNRLGETWCWGCDESRAPAAERVRCAA